MPQKSNSEQQILLGKIKRVYISLFHQGLASNMTDRKVNERQRLNTN